VVFVAIVVFVVFVAAQPRRFIRQNCDLFDNSGQTTEAGTDEGATDPASARGVTLA